MLFFSRNDFKISVVLSNPTDNEGNPVESIVSGGGLAHDYKFHSFHFHWVCNFVTVFSNRSALLDLELCQSEICLAYPKASV